MTLTPAELRADIPALERVTYLNTGASGPSPRRVVEAAQEALADHEYRATTDEGAYTAAYAAYDETRRTVADFLDADPDEVALTQSTADGLSRIASAFDWQPGDVVVRTDLEHSAGILPWSRLRDVADIEVRVTPTEHGRLDMEAFEEQVADARLVCLSSISWLHGTRLAVEDVVDIAHEHGARVLVDAVQSPGQVPLDVDEWGADFVVGAGHKWLLGVWGAGFVHVREGAEADLAPRQVGYRSVVDPNAERYELKPGAARLEVGTTSLAPYAGLREAIAVHEELGIDTIQSRIERLTDRLKAGIPDDHLISPREYETGLVAFEVDDPSETIDRLHEEGIRIRSLPLPETVRASVHAFNDAGDVDALLDALEFE